MTLHIIIIINADAVIEKRLEKKLQNVHQGYVLELGLPVIYFLFYFFKIYLFGSTGS